MMTNRTFANPDPHEEFSPLEFDIKIDGVDPAVLSALLARSELQLLNEEFALLIEKIRATRQALLLEHADKQKLALRAAELRDELERLRRRKELLLRVPKRIPLELLLKSLKEQEEQLEQLDEASASIDPAIRHEQKASLSKQIRELRKELKQSLKSAKKWLNAIAKAQRAINHNINRLEAKLRICDLSAEDFESEMARLQKSKRILEGAIQMLDEIVRAIKQK